jgi:hypothetical protein
MNFYWRNNMKLILAIITATVAGSVFAGDVTPFLDQDNFVSTRTRAEVRAEALQARAEGLLVRGDVMLPVEKTDVAIKPAHEKVGSNAARLMDRQFRAEYDVGS